MVQTILSITLFISLLSFISNHQNKVTLPAPSNNPIHKSTESFPKKNTKNDDALRQTSAQNINWTCGCAVTLLKIYHLEPWLISQTWGWNLLLKCSHQRLPPLPPPPCGLHSSSWHWETGRHILLAVLSHVNAEIHAGMAENKTINENKYRGVIDQTNYRFFAWRDFTFFDFMALFRDSSFARDCLRLRIPWYCFALTKTGSSTASHCNGTPCCCIPINCNWTPKTPF